MVVDSCTEASRHLLATSAALLFVTIALILGVLPTILRAYARAREFNRTWPTRESQKYDPETAETIAKVENGESAQPQRCPPAPPGA